MVQAIEQVQCSTTRGDVLWPAVAVGFGASAMFDAFGRAAA